MDFYIIFFSCSKNQEENQHDFKDLDILNDTNISITKGNHRVVNAVAKKLLKDESYLHGILEKGAKKADLIAKNNLAVIYAEKNSEKSKTISLTDMAMSLDTTITAGGAIDVEADVPPVFAARTHPLQDTIDEIRAVSYTHLTLPTNREV